MKQKQNTIRNMILQHRAVLIYMGIILIYIICIKEPEGGDAFVNFRYITDYTEVLLIRWNVWTSRMLIELPLYVLAKYPFVWKVCNFGIFGILIYGFKRIFKRVPEYLIACLMLLYPISQMGTSGWIAVLMNYMWPLAFCFISLIFIDKLCREKNIGIVEFIFYSICQIYALNIEQLAVVYIAILIYVFGWLVHHGIKKNRWMYVVHSLIAVISLAVFLFCPGNHTRLEEEITRWMIYFPQLHLMNKLTSGFTDTMNYIISQDRIFLPVVILVSVIMFQRFKADKCNRKQLAIAFLPLCLTLLMHCQSIFEGMLGNFYALFSVRMPDSMNYFMLSAYIPMIYYMVIVAAFLIALLYMFDDVEHSIELCFIFIVGLGSRVMLAFSPTLYGSNSRTFCIMEFTLIFLMLRLFEYNDGLLKNKSVMIYIKYILICYTSIAVLNDIGFICSVL